MQDIGIAGPHVLVDPDTSALADRSPAALARVVSGRTPRARITRSAGYFLPGFSLDFDLAFFQLREASYSVIERQVHAMLSVKWPSARFAIAVHGSENLVEHFDESDIETKMCEVLRHLKTDETATNNNRVSSGFQRLIVVEISRPEMRCPAPPIRGWYERRAPFLRERFRQMALQSICKRCNLPMLIARQSGKKSTEAFIRAEQRQELLCVRSGRSQVAIS